MFNAWLFNGEMEDADPPEWVIKALNPCMILQSFSASGAVTVFLNEVFNNWAIYQIDKMAFYKYLKGIITKKRITRDRSCFFKHHKENKDITLIHSFIPFLKRHEVGQFVDMIKEDDELGERFLITVGLKEEKKTKLTVAEKKEVAKRKEKMVEEEKKIQPTVSLSDWENSFG